MSDVQEALNDRGADLEVDGVFDETATASGLTGRFGSVTGAALGIAAPDSARIDYVAAGDDDSC